MYVLGTDWSKSGMGFTLLQKHCSCTVINPRCCQGGWRLVLAGGRFTKLAERNYKPIKGYALGVVYELQNTLQFTFGSPKLFLAVDHKPLVKVLSDRNLQDIDNPRLENLKEKTMPWRLKIMYVSVNEHEVPDALSKYQTKNKATGWR